MLKFFVIRNWTFKPNIFMNELVLMQFYLFNIRAKLHQRK